MKLTIKLLLTFSLGFILSVLPLNAQTESVQENKTSVTTDSVMVLPEGCSAVLNLNYKIVGEWKGFLDLYLPADTSNHVPLVLIIHGGGWNHGSKEEYKRNSLPFLKLGMAVANIEYRLLAVAKAPAAIEDVRCALFWLIENSDKYKYDVNNIITFGSSAGGHLALMAGILPQNSQFDKDCIKGKKYKVTAIINKYGITDVTEYLPRTHWLDNAPNKFEFAKELSPMTYLRNDIPPIITVHGDEDPTVNYNQGVRLHQALDSLKVKNVFYTVKGGKHGKFEKDENKKFSELTKEFLIELGIISKK